LATLLAALKASNQEFKLRESPPERRRENMTLLARGPQRVRGEGATEGDKGEGATEVAKEDNNNSMTAKAMKKICVGPPLEVRA
jgi:hypothetical protein